MNDKEEIEEREQEEVSLTKPKRPRTQKQIDAFQRAQQKRSENIAKKNEEKKIEAYRALLAKDKTNEYKADDDASEQEEELIPKKSAMKKQTPVKKPKKQVYIPEPEPESESEEEEIIYVKTAPKKRKPKKKTIIVEESSDDESEVEDDDEEEYQPPPKKPIVKRPAQSKPIPIPQPQRVNYDDYFA